MSPDVRRQSRSLAGRVRNMANLNKPHVEVQLQTEGQKDGAWIQSFSTLDKIQGVVSVTAPVDTRFDELQICLLGQAKSQVDKMSTASAVNSTSEAFQQFLKLSQPVDEQAYPESRTLKADTTYDFPFTFVVPEHLLPSICRHKCKSQKLKDAHLLLPPTLGDPEMSGHGSALLDDLAPSAVRISYSIRAQVMRRRERDGKDVVLSERARKIRIIPATEELPPVTLDERDDEYCLHLEKSIRKGIFKAKTGRISMEAVQPSSLRLPPPTHVSEANVTTTATVVLRFDPAELASEPPKLGSLTSKLKTITYWTARPQSRWPSRMDISSNLIASMFESSMPLSQRCISNTKWTRHEPHGPVDEQSRRDSAMSLQWQEGEPSPTSAYKLALPYYTAHLPVPITLPKDRSFVPTFFSCLISRVYILELGLGIPVSGGLGSSLHLKVPVQISSDTTATAGRRSSVQQQMLQSEPDANIEDEYFTPRHVSTNPDGASSPEYDAFDRFDRVRDALPPPPEYSEPRARLNTRRSDRASLHAPAGLMALIHAR